MDMVRVAQKKLHSFLLLAYTAVSVLGTFSLAVLEPYQTVTFEIENNIQDNNRCAVENFFIQHSVEEPVALSKLGDPRCSRSRISVQRIAALPGSLINGTSCSASSIIAGIAIPQSAIKNNISLKLRI
jgi:hypothetical protein